MELNSNKEIQKNWLFSILQSKIENNSNYSLRAFAKQLEISPSTLSRIFNGKRSLTLTMAIHVADSLGLGPEDREYIYNIFSSEIKSTKQTIEEYQLSVDSFTAISDWYHYGITQLINTSFFRNDVKWISKQLQITETETQLAIERLIRLNLIEINEHNELRRTKNSFYTTTDIPSSGLRKFQKQILEKAITSLEEDSIEERDITSITIATDERNLPFVKKEIQNFRRKMANLLSKGKPNRVYNLGVHLIPLSKKEMERK